MKEEDLEPLEVNQAWDPEVEIWWVKKPVRVRKVEFDSKRSAMVSENYVKFTSTNLNK